MARLLLDTQILVWFPTGDSRLGATAKAALLDPDNDLFVSAVTAFELTDLQMRGRIAVEEDVADIGKAMGFRLLDLPAISWAIAQELPDIHRDPVDRMTIAHAIALGLTLVTSDRTMRRYPVETLW